MEAGIIFTTDKGRFGVVDNGDITIGVKDESLGIFAGLSGAELTLGQMGYFSRGITASRGYMAFAITVLGAYNPPLILVAALFIGIADAFQIRAQSYFNIPGQFFIILPYVMTILALVVGKHFKGPAHEGEPYIRE